MSRPWDTRKEKSGYKDYQCSGGCGTVVNRRNGLKIATCPLCKGKRKRSAALLLMHDKAEAKNSASAIGGSGVGALQKNNPSEVSS